ncbi:FdtA/QdtA family cupin domain-containing protein [Shewanella sp. SM73]|uniref:sugar 3,4-ketoisomerase n=1 Tax=Shewanella sp. SM73 TaxID=2912806 RepID=UPI0021D849BC|nr:FdtA/QdtA family cupin domain-containing protein [Shewanella sp. SM73]MCU8031116.1 FdtA/QdtA family cupin domain-containing protein [Shewanella sp. SM73]
MIIKLIPFQTHGDDRGALVALEEGRNIPFPVKRVYYLFNTKEGVGRGFHAHKALKQIAICLKGHCRFVMDNGVDKAEIILNSPSQGLLIDIMQWHEMYDFSDDCILLVLASDLYNESDYIRDYEQFIKEVELK